MALILPGSSFHLALRPALAVLAATALGAGTAVALDHCGDSYGSYRPSFDAAEAGHPLFRYDGTRVASLESFQAVARVDDSAQEELGGCGIPILVLFGLVGLTLFLRFAVDEKNDIHR